MIGARANGGFRHGNPNRRGLTFVKKTKEGKRSACWPVVPGSGVVPTSLTLRKVPVGTQNAISVR